MREASLNVQTLPVFCTNIHIAPIICQFISSHVSPLLLHPPPSPSMIVAPFPKQNPTDLGQEPPPKKSQAKFHESAGGNTNQLHQTSNNIVTVGEVDVVIIVTSELWEVVEFLDYLALFGIEIAKIVHLQVNWQK